MIWMRISDPSDPRLNEVADALMAGEITIIPTETVYGLASTIHPDALLKVFRAKGRPDHKPLILGVTDAEMARSVASKWPSDAERLATAFWPGPLSLVVPKAERLPLMITAGGATVAVRAPQHPIAYKLIELVGQPLVLTSANRSEESAPVTAWQAVEQLALHPSYVIDAGRSAIGSASTIYDVSSGKVAREGHISEAALNSALAPNT
jgi:L-threonylcarbamoyladenylate synthase